jgi:hypothetical protein
MDEFAEKRSAAEGRSWREHVDEETRGQFGWSALRGYVYIVNSTWGSVPWENAHTVPASGQDRFSDPIIDDKSGYEPLCRHGKPLSHQCDKCDEDTVADGGGALMDVEGGKKKLLRKKKVFRKKGGSQ